MKKYLITIAITMVLIITGLSGCTEKIDTVPIAEIAKHPNRYVNTTITTKGFYATRTKDLWDRWIYTLTDNSGNSILAEVLEGVDDSDLIQNREYYWTGKITQNGNTVKLEVSEIQPV